MSSNEAVLVADEELDGRLLDVLQLMKKHNLTVLEFIKGFMNSSNHGIRVRRGHFYRSDGIVESVKAMLVHKLYGPGKRVTRTSRKVMSEELDELLGELIVEIVEYELDHYSM